MAEATPTYDQLRQYQMTPAGAIPNTPRPRYDSDDVAFSTNDTQVGGTHYKDMAVQPWDAMAAWMTPEQFSGFLLGSAVAYLARVNTTGVHGKGGRQDVAKAAHYLAKWLEVNPE